MTLAGCLLVLLGTIFKGGFLLFSYLNNLTFPHPLTEEQERECLRNMKSGSEEAKNRLIEHNLRLVAHVVKKYEVKGEDAEDLISIGTIGLIKAIKTFDETRGTRLATYASRCIENEVLMYLRNMKKVRMEVSLYDPIGYDKEGNEISLLDVLFSENEIVDIVEMKMQEERIRDKLSTLTRQERQVIEMRYGLFSGLKETQREIAKKLGISRSYVSRIEKKAIGKIIKELALDVPPAAGEI
ncbi:MAG: RNA polymerase sporulation sigma factor SigK [Chitinophagales bacterium]